MLCDRLAGHRHYHRQSRGPNRHTAWRRPGEQDRIRKPAHLRPLGSSTLGIKLHEMGFYGAI